MKIVHYQALNGNYGDELNKWLWPKIFTGLIRGYCLHGIEFQQINNQESRLFYGIGTILDDRIPPAPRKIIFGAGTGYGSPVLIDSQYAISFVRGPLTAKALKIDASYAVTDPAILLRNYIEPAHKIHRVSFMPHIDSVAASDFWQTICQKLDIHYISPRGQDVEAISSAIAASDLLITEAMHGAIVADTLRVPWVPVCSRHINNFKWTDWCLSLGLEYKPIRIGEFYASSRPDKKAINAIKTQFALQTFKKILRQPQTYLSDDRVSGQKIAQIENHIDALKSLLSKVN
ncbi:polysaccharide pyruvyl transferase family protein [Methylovulum psychrotolerans]|uniref:polysaccharide pyruvyl transferase family protein n=1 Tax=Methylovulum psychrotolerans TaxID=1704499 RepID=UPI001BFF6A71|nr:polysaccharide pyruvyl transferase family protein [Methylovulum psychrotolerans]MBT9097140.1 polysaccharide pyruvyl transferase family protein [Methylovulum psychrotolerans]